MATKFGHKGKTLLQNLIAGMNEAKRKWQVRYEAATDEYLKLKALNMVNWYAQEIQAYKRMIREDVRV
jgi:hypothetical protein